MNSQSLPHTADNTYNESSELLLPNEEQKPALKETQSSFWVTASAGSGKTMLLTQRFLALLLSGAAPERILCLTYTRAAAAEMSARILQALRACTDETKARKIYSAFFDKQPNDAEILRATGLYTNSLDCRGGLRIMTFHAFCQSVLGQFPLESGISPKFRLVQQDRGQQLKNERPFEAPSNKTPLTQEKLNHINAFMKNDACLKLAASIAQHYRSAKEIARARHKVARFFQVSVQTFTPCKKEVVLEKSDMTTEQLAQLRDRLEAMPALKATDIKRLQKIKDFLHIYSNTQTKEDSVELYLDIFLNKDHTLGKKTLLTKATLTQLGEASAKSIQQEAERLAEAYSSYYREQLAYLNLALYDLAQMQALALEENRKRNAKLDFDDLIDKTEELFSSERTPWVLYKLDASFDHVLIDEAQDTNSAQWSIVEKLTEEIFSNQARLPHNLRTPRSLFVVGDEKQSIYSFQGADLARFIAAREKFRARAAQAGLPFREQTLSYSYRSLAPVLKAVDQTFASNDMLEALQPTNQHSPTFAETAKPLRHEPRRSERGGQASLHYLALHKDEPTRQATDSPEVREKIDAEAKKLLWAERITDFVQKNILAQQAPQQRNARLANGKQAQPGDVMILLRQRKQMQSLINLFAEKGLPCQDIDKFKLAATIEAEDMLAWLRYLVQPEDELNLAGLLKSPFLDVSEELLQEVCLERLEKKNSLHTQLLISKNSQLCKCVQWLDKSQALARTLSPFEALRLLLDSPCPNANSGNAALIRAHTSAARDPITNLCDAAIDFEQNNNGLSITQFLQHIESLDIEITRESNAHASNKLRLMTIHGAKGLEAPIVVLPLEKTKKRHNAMLQLKTDKASSSLTIYAPNEAIEILATTKIGRQLEEQKQKQLDDAEKEEKRLLYVAMTRARDQLILLTPQPETRKESKSKSKKSSENPWSKIIKNTAINHGWRINEENNDQYYTLAAPPLEPDNESLDKPHDIAATTPAKTVATTPPSFLFSTPPAEPPPARARAASRLIAHPAAIAEDQQKLQEELQEQAHIKLTARKRGLLIHELVQRLAQEKLSQGKLSRGKLSRDKTNVTAQNWLAQALKPFDQTIAERKQTINEWLEKAERLIDTSPFFNKPLTSLFETEITGLYNGLEIVGRIDYLQEVTQESSKESSQESSKEHNDTLIFGDLKTDLSVPQTLPPSYAAQMGAYLALLEKIYPHKNIIAYILWFETAEIQRLDEKDLPKPNIHA